MAAAKNLGIWMDHLNAHLIEFTVGPMETENVQSKFTHQSKMESLSRGETLMHNKEQHQQSEYYKKLGAEIRKYASVLLFGPTDAKKELHRILRADHRFANIKIELQQAEKMTENQEHAFVRDHFAK